jgi:hypothetical protein
MSDYQKPCGYPVMDCALGVYVTKCEGRIEELEAENKRLRLEAAHANDTANVAIEQTKELEAALSEEVEWVKRLADDLNAAEGREARLKAKLAKAVDALETIRFFSGVHAAASDLKHIKESVNDVASKALAAQEGQG